MTTMFSRTRFAFFLRSRGFCSTTAARLQAPSWRYHPSDVDPADPLFNYTSGRWLFNEHIRLAERRLPFNKDALLSAIATATGRDVTDIKSLEKIAEGGFNRVLEATFDDGLRVLARLPYPATKPKHYGVASEVATIDLLRSNGVPVPKVFAYSPSTDNPVGVEYMLLEKIEGRPLSDTWFEIGKKNLLKVMKQITGLEKRLFDMQFPGSGSIYYKKDLTPEDASRCLPFQISTSESFVIGPITRLSWWENERASMTAEKGPWPDFPSTFSAPAIREIKWCEQYGNPQLPDERGIREVTKFEKAWPEVHITLLNDYLKLAPYLNFSPGDALARPILRHPDLSPSNILVTDDYDIVGFIDWQHAVVLPLCINGGIPRHFQNYGDPMSEFMQKPETELPPDFDQKTKEQQEEIRELQRKRLVHFSYAAYSLKFNAENWTPIRKARSTARARLYDRAAAPWEGNSLPLKGATIRLLQEWPSIEKKESEQNRDCGDLSTLPVQYGGDDIKKSLELEDAMDDRRNEIQMMQDSLSIDSLGFCQSDEHLEWAKDMLETFRSGILAECKTDLERKQLTDHWPFEDHDEEN